MNGKDQSSKSSAEIIRLREHIDRLASERRQNRQELERAKELIEELQERLKRTRAA